MKIVEAMAKTRKGAIQKALERLGCDLDEVEIEIVDEGSKGFMGIGQRDIRVRVKAPHLEGGVEEVVDDEEEEGVYDNIGNRLDRPDPQVEHQKRFSPEARGRGQRRGQQRSGRGGSGAGAGQRQSNQPHMVQPPSTGGESRSRSRGTEKRGGEKRGGDENRGTRSRRGSGDGGKREDRGPRQQNRNRPAQNRDHDRVRETPSQSKPKPRKVRTTPVDREAAETLGKSASALLAEILEKMSMPGDVTNTLNRDENILLEVVTEHGGILIGRKGKNLEALQFLINRIFVSGDDNETVDRILIDIEGYRKRRREQLEDMARSMAEKVKSTGRSLRVKPLDPQERRIIHLVLEDDDEVRTFSLGSSLHRRVVIAPTEDTRPRDDAGGDNDDDGDSEEVLDQDSVEQESEDQELDVTPDEFDEDPDFQSYEDGESVTADQTDGDSESS